MRRTRAAEGPGPSHRGGLLSNAQLGSETLTGQSLNCSPIADACVFFAIRRCCRERRAEMSPRRTRSLYDHSQYPAQLVAPKDSYLSPRPRRVRAIDHSDEAGKTGL